MQEMVIYGVSFDMVGKQPIVLLKTVESNKFLPIWIGHPEAAAILMKLQGASTPRPMTHDLLSEMLGERSRIVLEGLLQFEAAHPRDEAHYYLGFVATHDNSRGRGIGEQLLRQNLALIDAEHRPAYLESSNPANLERYMRLGFEPVDEIEVPDGRPAVTTMWRPAR